MTETDTTNLEPRRTLYCSFCDKSQYSVSKLIASDNAYICNECVEVCDERLLEELFPDRVVVKVRMPAAHALDDTLFDSMARLVSENFPNFDIRYDFRVLDVENFKEKNNRFAIFSFDKIYGQNSVALTEYDKVSEELKAAISVGNVLKERFLSESKKVESLQEELNNVKIEFLDYMRQSARKAKSENETRAVMFVDVKGFSSYDQVEKNRVVGLLRGIVPTFISERGGEQVNMWGDSVVATFSDANDAIEVAIKFIRHLGVEQLEARIGIAWGTITISQNKAIDRPDIHGSVVDLAARIEPLAEPGEILLSKEFGGLQLSGKNARIVSTTRKVKKEFGSYKTGDDIELYKVQVISNF